MGSLLDNITVSLFRVLIGYILAVVLAVPLGVMMGYRSLVYNMFNNFIGLFRPIPPLAWVLLVLAMVWGINPCQHLTYRKGSDISIS